ncbi:hypothetical protein CALVIDRAFT_595121 [Calocera viscosa TUFC12733]|uniref:Uncharacterized protein n=1 Tax=Calocera viscosa (strain TUFC12733) TaxID=1330018 RepID=A0A167RJH9_CALVF|nr:hypothetical protein CALVIDRAFT_595121 [Calocera viscosa TUFC12733]
MLRLLEILRGLSRSSLYDPPSHGCAPECQRSPGGALAPTASRHHRLRPLATSSLAYSRDHMYCRGCWPTAKKHSSSVRPRSPSLINLSAPPTHSTMIFSVALFIVMTLTSVSGAAPMKGTLCSPTCQLLDTVGNPLKSGRSPIDGGAVLDCSWGWSQNSAYTTGYYAGDLGDLTKGTANCPQQAILDIACPALDTANEALSDNALTSTILTCMYDREGAVVESITFGTSRLYLPTTEQSYTRTSPLAKPNQPLNNRMHFSAPLLLLAAIATSALAAPAVTTCGFTCPPTDTAGEPLAVINYGYPPGNDNYLSCGYAWYEDDSGNWWVGTSCSFDPVSVLCLKA